MSSESNPLGDYLLNNESEEEISRLNHQYNFVKSVFGYPQLVPPGIDIAHVSRVMDVGTGTGAWALDFVSLPEVRDCDVQVFACDISTAKFPQKDSDKPEVRMITFFQHDVTKPFPDELLGTFDLVSVCFLVYALTIQGWKVALQNVYSLLKPGGYLLLREADIITYNHDNFPPSDLKGPDITRSLQGTSNVAIINRIAVGEPLKQGFVPGISYHLRRMLQEASFKVLSSQRVPVPFGNFCNFYTSRNGEPLSKYRAFTIWNYARIFNMITLAATQGGGVLELADGTRIATEEGRLELMDEIKRSLTKGGFMIASDWVAVRTREFREDTRLGEKRLIAPAKL